MQIILDGFKSTLKCLILFWCPFGRTSRKTYQYFILTCVICVVGPVILLVIWPKHYFPLILSKLLAPTLPYLYLGGIVLVVALMMLIIRRAHDLDIGTFCTIRNMMASRYGNASFFLRLSQEEGSSEPNKYGPAPEENK